MSKWFEQCGSGFKSQLRPSLVDCFFFFLCCIVSRSGGLRAKSSSGAAGGGERTQRQTGGTGRLLGS